MKTRLISIRPSTLAAALAGTAALMTAEANAQIALSGGTLSIAAPLGGLRSKITAGPAPGVVRLEQVPGARNGQIVTGVRAIQITSGAGPDQIEFEIIQNTPFEIVADTGAGDSDIKVKWNVPATATPLNPKVTLRQGAGTKKVWLDFESHAQNVDLDWNVTGTGTGTGEAKALVAFRAGSLQSAADLRFNMGTGVDKLDLVVDSMADDMRLLVASRGAEIVTTQLLADDPGSNLGVVYDVVGTARPNFVELLVDSAIPNVSLDYVIDGGTSFDEVKIAMNQLVPGSIRSTVDIDTAAGLDKVEVLFAGSPSSLNWGGLIHGGTGNDEIKFYSDWDTTADTVLAGGDGNDLILAEIKGALTSDGATPMVLMGGNGNDHLLLKADGGVRGTPPRLDGGAGTDSVEGPGVITNAEILP